MWSKYKCSFRRNVQGGPKKSDLEEKCLRNFKMFFDGVIIIIIIFKLCRKKNYGALKIRKMACSKKVTLSKKILFFVLFLFLLQGNSYSCFVLKFQVSKLKIAIEVKKIINLAAKMLFSKRLKLQNCLT